MVNYPPVIIDYAPDECGTNKRMTESANIPPEYLDPRRVQPEPYRITKGDVLEVSVFTPEENFSSEVVVAPDGMVYMLHLDGIVAEGRTPDDLASDIEDGIGEVLAAPSVAVVPRVKAGDYYMILGKVVQPGVYPLRNAVDLRQAIGQAGGILEGGYRGSTITVANLRESFVVRDGERLNIDFADLIHEGREDQNIYLQPGDYVYIASGLDQEIYLLGSIGGRAMPYKDGLTLIGALTPSYGVVSTDPYSRGNWKDVLIIRGSLDCPCVIRADFTNMLSGDAKDIYLQPGDIVYVPNQTMRFGRALVRLAIDSFVSAFISSAATHHVHRLLD